MSMEAVPGNFTHRVAISPFGTQLGVAKLVGSAQLNLQLKKMW